MKKLAIITMLGIGLGFSNASFATDYMDLYTNDLTVVEGSTDVEGGEIETSPMSFYLNPFINETDSDIRTDAAQDDKNTLYVFGIRI